MLKISWIVKVILFITDKALYFPSVMSRHVFDRFSKNVMCFS